MSTPDDSTSVTPPPQPARREDRKRRYANLFLLAILWADLFWLLQSEWKYNEQYSYGYVVPFLGAYLIILRWSTRPAPRPAALGLLNRIAFTLALAALVPLRVVFEANPDWRLLMWVHALLVFGLSVLWMLRAGGLPWLRHFGLPIAFFLVAVPWPTRIENPLIQGLMRGVALVSVEILNLIGIHALQYGNLIRLPNTLVGVEEACSGIRSFQSAIMAGFFFACWFRFSWFRFLLLICAGGFLSILLNLIRTFTLTLIAYSDSPNAMQRWHDPVGYFVTFGSFALVYALSLALDRIPRRGDRAPPPRPSPSRPPWPLLFRTSTAAFLAAFWLAGVGATEIYYRLAYEKPDYRVEVTPTFDHLGTRVSFPEIPEPTRALLRYNEGLQAFWKENGALWTVFYFKWNEGDLSSFVGVHKPENCLQAAGLTLVRTGDPLTWESDRFRMVLHTYTFRSGETPYQVFFAVWGTGEGTPVAIDANAADRFANVRAATRVGARQSLQIVITGVDRLDEAAARVRAFLDASLRLEFPG